MRFWSLYVTCFKRLWKIPWFYFLLILIAMGGASPLRKAVCAIITALSFSFLAMLSSLLNEKSLRRKGSDDSGEPKRE